MSHYTWFLYSCAFFYTFQSSLMIFINALLITLEYCSLLFRYRPSSQRLWSQLTDIPETVSSILLYSLLPSTQYEFSVSAQNTFGNSGWTPSVSMETKGRQIKSSVNNLIDYFFHLIMVPFTICGHVQQRVVERLF